MPSPSLLTVPSPVPLPAHSCVPSSRAEQRPMANSADLLDTTGLVPSQRGGCSAVGARLGKGKSGSFGRGSVYADPAELAVVLERWPAAMEVYTQFPCILTNSAPDRTVVAVEAAREAYVHLRDAAHSPIGGSAILLQKVTFANIAWKHTPTQILRRTSPIARSGMPMFRAIAESGAETRPRRMDSVLVPMDSILSHNVLEEPRLHSHPLTHAWNALDLWMPEVATDGLSSSFSTPPPALAAAMLSSRLSSPVKWCGGAAVWGTSINGFGSTCHSAARGLFDISWKHSNINNCPIPLSFEAKTYPWASWIQPSWDCAFHSASNYPIHPNAHSCPRQTGTWSTEVFGTEVSGIINYH
ncbi:hypothetical protein DFH27DRAFT_526225 [Peziza echinospora]|nr:hypothetical protein DFH27DRAFT_526225 [Peziza echinospora]